MEGKFTKCPQNIPKGRKIYRMAKKYTVIFRFKTFPIYPSWDFWFENKPSGNPAQGDQVLELRQKKLYEILCQMFFQVGEQRHHDCHRVRGTRHLYRTYLFLGKFGKVIKI
jgi:hypothetical protein